MENLICIDCHYIAPETTCAWLVAEKNEIAFIENNTVFAIPLLLKALKEHHLKPEDVRYLIVTHIHLDHAGGTAELLKNCPNAMVLAHPRAVRHIIDPTRLIESSLEVYGRDQFYQMYGDIQPVDEKRVRAVEDGEVIELGARKFTFFHTRGHANHHFCIYDSKTNGIFTGDSFGIRPPELQGNKPFLYASSSPTDFDYDEAIKTLQIIQDTGANKAYLTHFGIWNDMHEGQIQMKLSLRIWQDAFEKAYSMIKNNQNPDDDILKMVRSFFQREVSSRGYDESVLLTPLLKMDIQLNTGGIIIAAQRALAKNTA